MASDTEITKVRIVIRHLLWQIREVRKDRDAAWKWVNRFANTLQYQDLEQDPDQYALAILAEARSFNDQKKRNQQMRWVREQLAKEGVTSPTQEQLDEKWLEMYGSEISADGDIREDSQDRKSGTSATIYGDAATREGADESATVSEHMGRVPQNGTHPRIQGGNRAAQGAMSSSPSGAAQDGKFGSRHACSDKDRREQGEGNTASVQPVTRPESGNIYDQEAPSTISTDEALQSQRTGGSSVRGMAKVAQPSVRSRASFRNKEDFMAWAIDSGLDATDASECWEATMERGGKDKDGNKVNNFKAFATQWCRTRADNRRNA